mgnify:FL=1
MTLSNIFKWASAIAAMLAITACGQSEQKPEQKEEAQAEQSEITLTNAQIKAVGIEIGQMEKRNLTQVIRTSGNMEADPQSRADVTSLIGGMLRSITVKEGDNVRAGQVVAWIENTSILEMQKNYMAAVQELHAAQQELQRQKNMSAQGAGVAKNLQQAQNACSLARANASGLAQQLAQLSISPSRTAAGHFSTRVPIKAPIAGTVGHINVSTGGYADVSTVLMDIVNNLKMHCDIMVYEKDIDRVQAGQTVDMTLTNRPDVHIRGVVYGTNSSFVNEAKAIKAHVRITDRGGAKLMPGATVNALVNLSTQNVDALPDDAVVDAGGKKYIFVQTGERDGGKTHLFEQVEVSIGESELGYTHVIPLQPLPPGAMVVRRNAFYILSMLEGGEEED